MSSDRFEKSLAATGLTVDDIDYVMCTHLHVDHVGWNTRLENGRWVPTFPKAKYIMADRELAHWTQKEKDDPAGVPWMTESIFPNHRGQTRADRKERFCAQRVGAIYSHARPHNRPLLGPGRPPGTRRADHGRYDPLTDLSTLSRSRHASGP